MSDRSKQRSAADNQPALPQVVSIREVKRALGLSQSTLYRMRRAGEFPKPIRLSRARVGWPRAVIERWIANRSGSPPDTE